MSDFWKNQASFENPILITIQFLAIFDISLNILTNFERAIKKKCFATKL